MAYEKSSETAVTAVKQAIPPGGKPSGIIVYNGFLDSWRCIAANGKQVLSTNSKEAALRAYPNFIVKE